MRAPRAVTAAAIAAYRRDGVVCLRQAFGRDWLTPLAEALDEALARPGPHAEDYAAAGHHGRFFGDLDAWRRIPGVRRFVLESPAAAIAGSIMGAQRVNFFYDQVLIKEPGTSARTPWHQDQPYWAVAGAQVCSIWLPLDPVAAETCPEYVAGSHRWGRAFNPQHFIDGSPYAGTGLPALPDIEAERDRHTILRWALAPGDCLVFQAMIVHGAPGNRSPHRRRALATRWLGDDARYVIRPGEVAIPTFDPGLKPGERFDDPDFPLVWTRPT
ncbi:MAG: phytanoyl-CoA dioxygenase [Alphaproteobacteria bacterium]|nr:phytanoyl-CoA dioxygenase [Alphaproteobacteria bacterium]